MRRVVAIAHQLEEQVGGLGFDGDVADLVDDEQRVAAESAQLALQPAGVMGVGEAGDPLGAGGEQHPVACLAGPDGQADGQVGLARIALAGEYDGAVRLPLSGMQS